MTAVLLGRKVGMTRLFDEAGNQVPVTVIHTGPCYVSQVKTAQADGYDAVQIAFEDVKGRNSTMPLIGHDAAAGLTPSAAHTPNADRHRHRHDHRAAENIHTSHVRR